MESGPEHHKREKGGRWVSWRRRGRGEEKDGGNEGRVGGGGETEREPQMNFIIFATREWSSRKV